MSPWNSPATWRSIEAGWVDFNKWISYIPYHWQLFGTRRLTDICPSFDQKWIFSLLRRVGALFPSKYWTRDFYRNTSRSTTDCTFLFKRTMRSPNTIDLLFKSLGTWLFSTWQNPVKISMNIERIKTTPSPALSCYTTKGQITEFKSCPPLLQAICGDVRCRQAYITFGMGANSKKNVFSMSQSPLHFLGHSLVLSSKHGFSILFTLFWLSRNTNNHQKITMLNWQDTVTSHHWYE